MNNNLNMQNIENIDGYTLESLVGGGNKVFEIPLFQRNYSWGREDCEQIFNDIINSYKNNKMYYIGNFMFYKSSETTPKFNKFILIDGQQRITTLLLLLCAIRDSFDIMEKINYDFLINNNEKEKYKFKLKQNYNDYNDFLEIMKNEKKTKKTNIYTAYNTFIDLINRNNDINLKNIEKIYETIKKLESVGIELKNDNIENVQDIFEKINSTGERLSPADLIRNFLLFSPSIDIQTSLHNYWKIIENIVGEKNISKFVKNFLIRCTFEDVNNDRIYPEFKKYFYNQDHEKILKLMVTYSCFFAMIEEQKFYELFDEKYHEITEYDFNDKKNNGTKKYNQLKKLKTTFALLNKIGTDELNPFFFQLCNKLYYNDLDKLNDICELVLEFMIRYRIVQPSAGGGALSTKIRNIMKKIEKNKITMTKKDIYILLSENENSEASKYPTNLEFITSLKKGNVTIKNARVLLYQFARRKGEEISPFDNGVTVEHLMPQTINPKEKEGKWWIQNLGGEEQWKDIYNEYLHCIGNMVLVSRKLNSSLSNNIWEIKRQELSRRAMGKETQKVAKLEKWSKKQIKARNDRFSNEISQIITGPKFEKKENSNWL